MPVTTPADLAVIGLGRSGLPLARAATSAGISTLGYDADERAVATLGAGRPPGDGSLTAASLRRMLAMGFRATTDLSVLGRARTAVICVDTPSRPDRAPDPGPVWAAARALAPALRPRTTVILESTVYPGGTEEFLRTLLERGSGLRAGRDFHLACAPERTDPGDRASGRAGVPRVVGGLTPACTEAAAAFYRRLAERVVRARGTREAETARLLETSYQQVSTALVNEMAVFCHDIGVDVWDVIRCVETGPSGLQGFRPSADTGGPGAPAGPAQPGLAGAGRPPRPALRLTELAHQVNSRMPRYVAQRAAALLNEHGKSARGAHVLLLGVTRMPDLPGEESAPAAEVATRLRDLGARLGFHDPYVRHWQPGGLPVPRAGVLTEAAGAADLTVLLQHHRTYDLRVLGAKAQLLLDTRGVSPTGAAHRL